MLPLYNVSQVRHNNDMKNEPVDLAQLQSLIERANLVTPEQAAAAAGVSVRTIYRRVQVGKLQSVTTAAGILVALADAKNITREKPGRYARPVE